jgi:hypothetical protein
MTMNARTLDALHDIHVATNDVLQGYRELANRAEPDIQQAIARLTALHEQHAAAQATELARMHDERTDVTSLQGRLNKAVVVVRDWVSDLDRDVLPAVRRGEESLRDEYDKVLRDGRVAPHATVMAMLTAQRNAIDQAIAGLPRG